jgi:hypothetical protein
MTLFAWIRKIVAIMLGIIITPGGLIALGAVAVFGLVYLGARAVRRVRNIQFAACPDYESRFRTRKRRRRNR